LVEDIDQIKEWLDRQTTSSFESTHLEDSLVQLRAEVARRNKAVSAKTLKPPPTAKATKGKPAKAQPEPKGTSSKDDMPRVLLERSSIIFKDAEERRQEYDHIIAWLQHSDLSKEDRGLLRDELGFLAPEFQKDREQRAQTRRAAILSKALGITASNERLQVLEMMRRIDGIRPMQERPGISYLLDGSEMHLLNNEAVAALRANVLKSLDQAANRARNMNEATFSDGQDFLKLNYEDQKYVGFAVSVVSGEEPVDMWAPIQLMIQKSNVDVTSYRNLRSRGQVSLVAAAAHVLDAVDRAQQARSSFDAGRDRAVDAAGKIVTGLEITRDLAFSVDLALGAVLAAPVVAAGVGVGGLGFTGATAGALTIAGTGTVVGAEGVVLGGGSTALAGGSWQDVKSSAAKWGKRGVAAGVGGGATQVVGSALNVGASGLSTASNIARVTAAQTAGNVSGNVTGSILEGKGVKDTALSGAVGLGTSLVVGPLGSAASAIENPILRAGTNVAIGGATGYGATYALTGDKDEALLSAAVGAGTAGAASFARVPTGPTPGQRAAANAGRQVNRLALSGLNTARNVLAAGMIGTSRPVPIYRGTPSIPTEQVSTPVTPEEPAPTPQPQSAQASAEDAAIDRAFAEDAAYQTGTIKSTGRVRVTGSGRQLISLDNIALTPAQRLAAVAINGQQLDADMQATWQGVTNAREQAELAQINQLWNQGTPQSQEQARDLARAAFNRHRGRFWAAVRRDPQLRAAFESAGMRFQGGNTTAPIYDLPDGTTIAMTLEHSVRLTDNPTIATNGANLQFVLSDENSVNLEYIRGSDPFQP
jgi:hypothetical protein